MATPSKKKRRDLDTPRTGAAEKMWLTYARAFNALALEARAPKIKIPGAPVTLRDAVFGFISDESALRMKCEFFSDHIDRVHPLAEYGFDTARRQRSRSQESRSRFNKVTEMTLLVNREATNKELWDLAIGSARAAGLVVDELAGPQSLTWDDPDSDASGQIGFGGFQVLLSELRRQYGILKRPRRQPTK